MMVPLIKQKSKLEPTEKKAQELRVHATMVTWVSRENFEESALDHAQLLGNGKEKRKHLFY